MSLTRRQFMIRSAAVTAALALVNNHRDTADAESVVAAGPFLPSLDSLENYEAPKWFRDAKFGIFMHWGPCSVPGAGGWYGRMMYVPGSQENTYHLANYGHPSKVGYKDVCKTFNPVKFDQAQAHALVDLYKRAGAKYIVPVAVHHDNFDMWDSTYQPRWNSKAVSGKDVVGMWKKAATDHGLRLGVATHVARSYRWFQTSHGSDSAGPMAGVPYDGQDPDYADLYGVPWNSESTDYDQMSDVGPPVWEHLYEKRMLDLIDKYQPDLYYEDGGIPFHVYPAGLNILAHYYNESSSRNKGKVDAVATIKLDWHPCDAVQDYEGAPAGGLAKYPWQSDKSLNGDWFYNRHDDPSTFPGAGKIITTLIDNVSRNGNLLLNVPLQPDGALPEGTTAILEDLAATVAVVGEAIFGTRPWKISGEGDGILHDFSTPGATGLTENDFRFTTKGNVLYATAFGWPDDGTLTVESLSSAAPGIVGQIEKVSLLGSSEKIAWSQTNSGLAVTLPAQKPGNYVYSLKIEGLDLDASNPGPPPPAAVRGSVDGLYRLTAEKASMNGGIQLQAAPIFNLGYWNSATATASWIVDFIKAGTYSVEARVSSGAGVSSLIVDAGSGPSAPLVVQQTIGFDQYELVTGADVTVAAPGYTTVTLRAADPQHWNAINLAEVTLRLTV